MSLEESPESLRIALRLLALYGPCSFAELTYMCGFRPFGILHSKYVEGDTYKNLRIIEKWRLEIILKETSQTEKE